MRIEDISDEVWSVPGKNSIIDAIVRETGLTCYLKETPAQVLARHPDAIRQTWADWRQAAIARQQTPIGWRRTTKARYHEMLEVLPPAMWIGGAFLVGEPQDHDIATGSPRFDAFRHRHGVYEASDRPITRAELRAVLAPQSASIAADIMTESKS
jgi:hypothetical protein